ncbi:hypothetical protein E0H64_12535 [Rhizobium leguminosarum bv. viciae]|uniref:hypothetical protein n=1 Tax=Rhizobium leguminosarum TaxID=384 RepID=UPI00103A84A9|nr:hypothetical protein [Rhizobium leguminosarum]MBY5916548.1 hypothetical protein [Rhizobium leguminosarum]TBZ69323.1 hypothetical protein E0H64_12535 [Rhizobium leguminosarum bv. viciae]
MPDSKESPTVQSMEIERVAQRERALKGNLDKSFEDTFPASDPTSPTHTPVPAGRTGADDANRVRQQAENDDFPLVAQALRSTEEGRRSNERINAAGDRVRALRRDAERIAETASEVASGATSLAASEVRSFLQDVEGKIRARPIAAVAIVAPLALVLGANR